jgi:FkbM family methyltransferase
LFVVNINPRFRQLRQFRMSLLSRLRHDRSTLSELNRDDIIAAFELILGHPPISETDILYHLGLGFSNRSSLGEYLVRTDEFSARYEAMARSGLVRPGTVRPHPIFLGDRVLGWTHCGQRIYLAPHDVDLTPRILFDGSWEPHVEETIRRLARPGDTVIDLGANVGYHTIVLGTAVGPQGKVFAFEANPMMMPLLEATVAVNGFQGWVQLFSCAILDQAGTISLAWAPNHYGSGNVVPKAFIAGYADGYPSRVDVPAETLDSLLAEQVSMIDLIHMDIEGSEPLALRGAERLIERSPTLKILTEWSINMMGARADIGSYVSWLSASGFRFWSIDPPTFRLSPITASSLLELPHCDVLMSRVDPE